MKVFSKSKDGGPESNVDGYFILECKGLFSIAILKFNKGCREKFHTHAFHALTWFVKGDLVEEDVDGSTYTYTKSLLPKLTRRSKNHRVRAKEDSWCITLRGPWCKTWTEFDEGNKQTTTFTHGRKVLSVN